MNMAELAIYRSANEACQTAAREAEEARRILGPGLPAVDPGLLDAAKKGLFVEMLFGGWVWPRLAGAANSPAFLCVFG
jgi:hypothetical protein